MLPNVYPVTYETLNYAVSPALKPESVALVIVVPSVWHPLAVCTFLWKMQHVALCMCSCGWPTAASALFLTVRCEAASEMLLSQHQKRLQGIQEQCCQESQTLFACAACGCWDCALWSAPGVDPAFWLGCQGLVQRREAQPGALGAQLCSSVNLFSCPHPWADLDCRPGLMSPSLATHSTPLARVTQPALEQIRVFA